jgi:hypothetical protein
MEISLDLLALFLRRNYAIGYKARRLSEKRSLFSFPIRVAIDTDMDFR